ncbi:MAG TPA: hypothetical protein VGP53_02235, partial [Acidimicrobiales bacterium]|nr:hypothetical protein [Acidimicrobiales bacterium]
MRLRSRAARPLGEDWVRPSGAGRWTTVGNLDSAERAFVDPAGLVAIAGCAWSLDWWIGAEDRWHVPAREVAVRQALIGESPVVETRVRVPSGDAVQRVYAARGPSGEDVLVVEVHNDTKVPFAVALAVRPYDLGGTGGVGTLALGGTTVTVDGAPAIGLSRSPGRIALSAGEVGDAAVAVFAGEAEPVAPSSVRCPDRLATAALLFPLAHTATLRVVLPLAGGSMVDPSQQPSADQVASGWGMHVRRATRFEVPNRRLRESISASTRFLLLATGDPRVAPAMDLVGLADEAAASIMTDPVALARTDQPGAALHALGQHWRLTRDVDVARASAALVVALVRRLDRAGDGADRQLAREALPWVADLLDGVGEARGAADVRAVPLPRPEPGSEAFADVEALVRSASPTWTWASGGQGHDITRNAELLTAVRHLLVREVAGGLALSSRVPEAWLGQGWEVHGAPTAAGRLSYAVRWHGERPALLWELDAHDGLSPARLTIPGLDPDWSTTE